MNKGLVHYKEYEYSNSKLHISISFSRKILYFINNFDKRITK